MRSIEKSSKFKFKVINPGHYLDALLFWSVYTSTAMLILWLLTSTAKNQLREAIARQYVSMAINAVDMLDDYPDLSGGESSRYLRALVSSHPDVIGAGVVKMRADGEVNAINVYDSLKHRQVDYLHRRHQPYLLRVLGDEAITISDWEIFTTESMSFLTPPSEEMEFIYARMDTTPTDDLDQGCFLIIALDANAVQLSFYSMEDLGVMMISLAIMLGTVFAIFVRLRSAQRMKANEDRFAALESLRVRDSVLNTVVEAADKLLGQGPVQDIYEDLLGRLKGLLDLDKMYAVVEDVSTRAGNQRKIFVTLGLGLDETQPFRMNDLDRMDFVEYRKQLNRGDVVIIHGNDTSSQFYGWMNEKGLVQLIVVAMLTEGQITGLIVIAEDDEETVFDAGILDTLKLTADIFSAAYLQRHQSERMRLSSKMEALGRMAGGVAHEFNNLLHVISANLRRLNLDTGNRERSSKILEASERGSRIVNQLLGASRLNVLDLKPGNLNTIVEKTVTLAESAIGSGVRMEVNLSERLPRVQMDEGQIQQVILNLILNAKDAIDGRGKIMVRTGKIDSDVFCEVRDTGLGIPDDDMEHLFEPFFTTKMPGQGTGLGLSTSSGILQQHKGSIEARNHPGGGAMFTFYLPISSIETITDQGFSRETPVFQCPEGKVVIADDEELCREVLIEALGEKDIDPVVAEDGDELLSLAERYKGQIDWIITDWTMPGVHGAELIQQLRSQLPEVKIFVTSGFVLNFEDMPHVEGFINKPFGPEELFRVLEKATQNLPS
ncbi:MAG: ATP-binding protein [Verrucomicrobiota bacterium]